MKHTQSYNVCDRSELQKEMNQLTEEIDRIAGNTEFNTKKLLGGSSGTDVFNGEFHIGANSGQSINLTIANMRASGIGLSGLNVTIPADLSTVSSGITSGLLTQSGADAAITTIDGAIEKVSSQRSALGAVQNRLEHTIANLDNSSENLSAAESRIRDVDMAKEMMEMTKSNILSQASQSMLAQANQQPQSVLQLLG